MTRYKEHLRIDRKKLQTPEFRKARGLKDLSFATLHMDTRDSHLWIDTDGTRNWAIPRDYDLDHQGLVIHVDKNRTDDQERSLQQILKRFGVKETREDYVEPEPEYEKPKRTCKKKEEVEDDE